ncbi:MAG: hypothetical protein GF313_17060 [Caldithrix sp.]|nr:hypothetical protein [Caldithrix sp.]
MPDKEINVLPVLYDLLLWYAPKLSRYPKTYKYTLGQRITNVMLDILEALIEARYASKNTINFLRQA